MLINSAIDSSVFQVKESGIWQISHTNPKYWKG